MVCALAVAACGDKENKPRFNPETDWVVVEADTAEDIGKELRKLSEALKADADEGVMFLEIDPSEPLYFRMVKVVGEVEKIGFDDLRTSLEWAGIYVLDLTATKLEEIEMMALPRDVRSVWLPETMVDLGAAFAGCGKMGDVMVIPKSVRTIEDRNFDGLDKVKVVEVRAEVPPTIVPSPNFTVPVFPDEDWVLTVPQWSLETYKAHEWWGQFKEIRPIIYPD
jgi:hypothetical protein